MNKHTKKANFKPFYAKNFGNTKKPRKNRGFHIRQTFILRNSLFSPQKKSALLSGDFFSALYCLADFL